MDIRSEMARQVVFGGKTSLKRNIIEKMQSTDENKYLKEFTPEELMTFVGYIAKQKDEQLEVEEMKKIRSKSKDKKFYNKNNEVAKEAINILEEKINNIRENKKEEEMSEIDEYIYNIAEEYIKAEQEMKTNEENGKKKDMGQR